MSFDVSAFLLSMLILVISITIHEFSHAITADRLGDPTPRYQGRVTLDPVKHLDPVGTIMIVLSSLAGFGIGWGKPVQVNPRFFRTTPLAGMGIVAIAGPISNMLLALLGAILLRVVPGSEMAYWILSTFVTINVALAFFNLIPVFPLDGYNVLLASLDSLNQQWADRFVHFWQRQAQYGAMMLILLLLLDRFSPMLSPINWIFAGPVTWVTSVLL